MPGQVTGNSTTLATSASTIDSTAPSLTISSPAASSYVNIANVSSFSISGTCSEEGRNVAISGAANATAVCTSGAWNVNLNLSPASQGSLTVNITQSDIAGNTTTISRTYSKDTLAPTLAISSPSAGSYINSTNVAAITVSGSCSENGQTISFSGALTDSTTCSCGAFSKVLNFSSAIQGSLAVTVSADGSSQTATCTSGSWNLSFDFTGSPDGTVSVSSSQTDLAGNNGTGNLSLDKSTGLPTLGVTTPAVNSYVKISNTSNFAINGICSVNGNAVNITAPVTATATCTIGAWTVSLDLTSIPDGTFTLAYNHTDNSGNMATGTRALKKDTVAPTAIIASPIAGSYISSANVGAFTVSGTCSENSQTVAITGDATGSAPCTAGTWSLSLSFATAAEGTVRITATHLDLAGNFCYTWFTTTKF